MARQRFDIGSKWLIHNQGKATLFVGGLKNVTRCEPMPGEVVQNRRYPDGLLRAYVGNDPKPHPVLIEIATFPERRALKQATDDLTLAYSSLGHLPDLLMLVLRPKGKFRIDGVHAIQSEFGMSHLQVAWRVVELWTLSAEEFLEKGDVGIMPLVPLMNFVGQPETLLERCAKRIEREAQAKDLTDLQVVAHVMSELRFPGLNLLSMFGGQKAMIESPFLQKMMAQRSHDLILDVLKDRFDSVPRDVTKPLRAVSSEKQLRKLAVLAATCTDLNAFREALKP